MVDMESTLDPRLLVSLPSLMLDSLCRDMPLDMAMDMPDMVDTMAPMPPLLLLVELLSVVMDSLPLLHTMPPMAMLLLGSMLLTLLALSTLPRGLLMLMPTMVDTTLDPRPLVSLP